MSRIYGKDITNTIVTKMTSDFNTMLSTIETERSLSYTIPQVLHITDEFAEDQLPEMYVHISESETEITELNNDIDFLTEVYTVHLTIAYKTASNLRYDYGEYYIEAIMRVLYGYNDADITWIFPTNSIRAEFQSMENYTTKVVGVDFEVRIN